MMAPGLWSEEFQQELLLMYVSLPRHLPFVFGLHVWNLTDFRTPQMHIRAGGVNHKGAFTRLREPKLAAHALRRAWAQTIQAREASKEEHVQGLGERGTVDIADKQPPAPAPQPARA